MFLLFSVLCNVLSVACAPAHASHVPSAACHRIQPHWCVRQASGIPAFYVAFCVTPFASNASELVSSFMFARRKQRKNISLTFSQARCPLQRVDPRRGSPKPYTLIHDGCGWDGTGALQCKNLTRALAPSSPGGTLVLNRH